MKHCEHCGRGCKKRVPRMVRGKIAMVGSRCSKHFKSPKRSDLYNAVVLGPLTISHDLPKQVTEQEFHDHFNSKIYSTKKLFSSTSGRTTEWYVFQGFGLAISAPLPGGLFQHSLIWPYSNLIKVKIYDPYTGKLTIVPLLYRNNYALGDTVEQESLKWKPGYSQVVQDFLDMYPKWDPIATYVQGSVRKSPGYAAPAAPAAATTSSSVVSMGTDASVKYKSWREFDAAYRYIVGGLAAYRVSGFTGSPRERASAGKSLSSMAKITDTKLLPANYAFKQIPFGTVPFQDDFKAAYQSKIGVGYEYFVYYNSGIIDRFNDSDSLYDFIIDAINNQFDAGGNLNYSDSHGATINYDNFSLAAAILYTLGYVWPEH